MLKVTTLVQSVVLLFGLCGSLAHAVNRDFSQNPVVVQIDTTETVYAIGDAHGDPQRFARALLAAGLISALPASPDQVKWAAGKAVLVVTGDMIDKWDESLGVIALLRALARDTAASGGQVVISMGNHEAEFLAKPDGKKTKEFADELKAAGLNPAEVGACQGDLGQFLCNLPVAVRVNDWFFSHGGNTGKRSIVELSAAIASGINKDGFATSELIGDNSILEARLNKKGPNGMPWFMNGDKNAPTPKHCWANTSRRSESSIWCRAINLVTSGFRAARIVKKSISLSAMACCC